MKHINSYKFFESVGILTSEQEAWLNKSALGSRWDINEDGLVDVYGGFWCNDQGLTDFKGVKFGHIKGNFICKNNLLESLEGAPINVEGSFVCDGNRLTSLVGAPTRVGESLWCEKNRIVSLEGLPVHIGGNFWSYDNPVSEKVLDAVCREMLKVRINSDKKSSYTEAFLECLSSIRIPDSDFALMLFTLPSDISDPILVKRVKSYIENNPIKKIGLVSDIKKKMPNLYSKISEEFSSDAELMSDLGELGF